MKASVDIHKGLMNYRDLLTRVDRLLESIQRHYSGYIVCHKGCDCGCRNLSVVVGELAHVLKLPRRLSIAKAILIEANF